MNKKVCFLSDQHLSVNPRLWKEAILFDQLGFHVVVLTMWHSNHLYSKDISILEGTKIIYKCYLNIIPEYISVINHFYYRAKKKIFGLLQKNIKIGTGHSLSYAPELMYKKAVLEDADLYVAHLECAFFVGRKLIMTGKKVAFDFEDWYSNDYLVPERAVNLLRKCEKYAIEKGIYVTAASDSMSEALQKEYGSARKITTIYNGFSISESKSLLNVSKINSNDDEISFIWFSRTIGPNRGIEKFIDSLRYTKRKISLHLLGFLVKGYDRVLEEKLKPINDSKIYFHEFIDHKNLLKFIMQFDVGLAIEEKINQNRDLTVTNKVLQYLQSGIQVICSDTQGHREVQQKIPSQITIINLDDPISVATKIDTINKRDLTASKIDKDRYNQLFSWESQAEKLKAIVQNTLI